MVVYKENPKDSIKTLIEVVNQHSKMAGYKILCIFICRQQGVRQTNKENNPIYNDIEKY